MTPMTALFLRVCRALQTAVELAADFAGHPALSVVLYPGLPGHPGRLIAAW
jgi:cystathionine gamma-synthase